MDMTWAQLVRWAVVPTPLVAAAVFAGCAAVLWPLEWAAGRRPGRRPGLGTDLLFWAFVPLAGKAATFATVVAVAAGLMELTGRDLDPFSCAGWGPVGRQPLWLQAAEVLILADFVFYWTHRAFHATRLWPFHAVHHSSTRLDWLSSMRFHPVNDVISRVCQSVPLVLAGFAPAAVVCMIPVVVAFIVLTHAAVPWTWGPLRYVFVSPVSHHWHHSTSPEAVDKNFAGVLVLWDWLFGTLYLPAGRRPETFGVIGGGTGGGFFGLLWAPFAAVLQIGRRKAPGSTTP
jgi:sterol desaturase/sphingolipid hydroxylase (fatty acid hydroxylase superfamily)